MFVGRGSLSLKIVANVIRGKKAKNKNPPRAKFFSVCLATGPRHVLD